MLNLTFSMWQYSDALAIKDMKFSGKFVVVNYPIGETYQFGEAKFGVMLGNLCLKVDPVQVLNLYISKLESVCDKENVLCPAFRASGSGICF